DFRKPPPTSYRSSRIRTTRHAGRNTAPRRRLRPSSDVRASEQATIDVSSPLPLGSAGIGAPSPHLARLPPTLISRGAGLFQRELRGDMSMSNMPRNASAWSRTMRRTAIGVAAGVLLAGGVSTTTAFADPA